MLVACLLAIMDRHIADAERFFFARLRVVLKVGGFQMWVYFVLRSKFQMSLYWLRSELVDRLWQSYLQVVRTPSWGAPFVRALG